MPKVPCHVVLERHETLVLTTQDGTTIVITWSGRRPNIETPKGVKVERR